MSDSGIALACLLLTIGLYALNKRLYQRHRRLWLAPIVLTPLLLIAVVVVAGIPYPDYVADTRWLGWLLGPATIAFALPLYDYRALIARHWLSLTVGVGVAVVVAVGGTVWLARLFDLPVALQKALAARSVTTPFAVETAKSIGGATDLASLFVILTGIAGMVCGETVLALLPVRSKLARGAIFGAASHGAGTAKARELGEAEGVVACLVMMIAGFVTVLGAPLIAKLMF